MAASPWDNLVRVRRSDRDAAVALRTSAVEEGAASDEARERLAALMDARRLYWMAQLQEPPVDDMNSSRRNRRDPRMRDRADGRRDCLIGVLLVGGLTLLATLPPWATPYALGGISVAFLALLRLGGDG